MTTAERAFDAFFFFFLICFCCDVDHYHPQGINGVQNLRFESVPGTDHPLSRKEK
jgi:hypothetical protein